MNALKVGKAIAYLRKRVGFTQRELADRIGVSDKAVSKWERGLGLPDTSIIGKIAILLDSDTDSLLSGDLVHHNKEWTGLWVLKENSCGINAGTIVYDKPVAYYILSYFILMGIHNISIMCEKNNALFLEKEFGNGEKLGLQMVYLTHMSEGNKELLKSNTMVVVGMTILYGVDQTRFFQKAMFDHTRTTVLSIPKNRKFSGDRIYFDSDKKLVNIEDGVKLRTQYDYYQIPIAFCPSEIVCNMDFNNILTGSSIPCTIIKEDIYTVVLDRGFVEISLNTWDDVRNASEFVKIVQQACGMHIYCIEEIAWRRGMISHKEFISLGEEKKGTPYGDYILEIAGQESKR